MFFRPILIGLVFFLSVNQAASLPSSFYEDGYEDYEYYDEYEDGDGTPEVEISVTSTENPKTTSTARPISSKKECTSCRCGIPNRWTRIIGGWMTEVSEYPWMVALTMKGRLFCGGTLISDQYVLTAAHCVLRNGSTDWVRSSVSVVLAEHNTADMSETMKESSRVSSVKVHPGFAWKTFDHDLALLKLDRKIAFRHSLRSACLPPKGGEYHGEWGTVAGWGLTTEGGTASAYLRETTVPILSLGQCRQRGYQPSKITENMICAGDYNMMDSCQGDSGGALLVSNSENQMMAVGVVSWGEGCARPGKPGVYTRVDKHVDWIKRNTQESCFCR